MPKAPTEVQVLRGKLARERKRGKVLEDEVGRLEHRDVEQLEWIRRLMVELAEARFRVAVFEIRRFAH
jgi:hypothetical protein